MTSTIKVDNIQKVSDGSSIIKKCGSTITVGSCGATVALASGASQTGFGRTGTVNWCTTVKTSPFTATSGSGFFVNTTGGTVTVTLPSSPSAGDIVSIADYAGTAATACKQIAIGRGGSKFQGTCNCGVLNKARESVTLIYVDGTQGWVPIQDQEGSKENREYITATGGTITCSGDYKIHTFTSSGCFQVTAAGNAAGSNKVSYVVVAAGGGAGGDGGGGGGAGGFREGKCTSDPYADSPLDAGAGLSVPVATYPITIGAGGAGGAQPAPGNIGNPSVFSSITSTGGGLGGSHSTPGGNGGSGGGGQRGSPYAAGTGNTPPVSPAQGTNGGPGGPPNGDDGGGGGGGATVAGSSNGPSGGAGGGAGGAGATSSINGTPTARAGGGGGGSTPKCVSGAGVAGAGGGGTGVTSGSNATSGTANTGGGGGGSSGGPGTPVTVGGSGGSGIVIIRYKFQN